MRLDRRTFLKGAAAAYMATRLPTDVYGLSEADAQLIFPRNQAPGTEFQIRIHGRRTVKWPKAVLWQTSEAPVASGGVDLFRFVSGSRGRWYGSAIQDFR